MQESLNNYILKKEQEKKEQLEKEKSNLLISEGLYEKVYSEKEEYDSDYPFDDWDGNAYQHHYYKKVPIEITDEEYKIILELNKSNNVKKTRNNGIATTLTIIAWVVFVVGFIAGIILGNVEVTKGYIYTYTDTEFSFIIAFTYWAISFISGSLFLGFAEIIKLLNDIKNK